MSRPLKLVLHNIRSTYNVGAILRTAEGLGVTELVYSGYTPRYADARLLPHLRAKLDRQIAKSALGAETLVPQTALADNPASWLAAQRAAGWLILGLENNLAPAEQPRRLILGRDRLPVAAPAGWVLLLGEEVAGIPADLRSALDYFLEIPMVGRKESFNVSVATAIAVWALKSGSVEPLGN